MFDSFLILEFRLTKTKFTNAIQLCLSLLGLDAPSTTSNQESQKLPKPFSSHVALIVNKTSFDSNISPGGSQKFVAGSIEYCKGNFSTAKIDPKALTMSSGAVKGQVKGQMKGLLKGLRYISQIFDEEENKEIQIGFPTDVKHLAHIGAENAKASQPSWLTEFKESPEGSVGNSNKSTAEDNNSDKGEGKRSRKSRARSAENQSTMGSEGGTEGSKPSRRHNSESSNKKDEKPPTTKHSHRRKSKTTSSEDKDGGSVRREDKEGSSRRASRNRRQSKGDSLTEFSFSDSGTATATATGPN
ncbi:hypothetical protein VNO78_20135 [Psophocarpus tetragonolobus]|uniref:CRIB domain-containing protein n=1 Tax=Psophocarpus tetragonolobus TaxID=3891 RepID=A0AAN9XGX7_PSOTE